MAINHKSPSGQSKKISTSKFQKKKRVLVAMSGGVDSSVAAALLLEQGYDVIGVTMQVWDYSKSENTTCDSSESNGTCCSSIDVDDARAVADKLGIPFYVMNCEEEFKETVIDNFVGNYLEGITPIPCVNCNTYLKFNHLLTKMRELNCDYLATGHYAQVSKSPTGRLGIETSSDDWKDQTYFLFTINSEIIPYLMFPVGHLKKPALREMALEMKLPVAKKKDSTGICFIGKGDYSKFVEKHSNSNDLRPGLLRLYPSGKILGEHTGIHKFTYGQRKGLGISYAEPLYVVKLDAETHDVWLGLERSLYSSSMTIERVNFLDEISEGEVLKIKIRFAHEGSAARITEKITVRGQESYRIEFDEPQRSITPGQAAVMYRNKQLLGGGWIL